MVKDYKPISIDRRMPDEYYGPCFEFYCVFSGQITVFCGRTQSA